MGIKSDILEQLEGQLKEAKDKKKEAEQTVVFCTGQIDRLNATINTVKSTLTADDDHGTPTRKPKAAPKSGLPRTGNDFWLSLITDKPQKVGEILDAACTKAQVTSDEDKAILKNRMAGALKALTDAKTVASEGAQQNRVYHLPKKAA